MVKKISNLGVLGEMYRRVKDKVEPIDRTEKFLQDALHMGRTYLLNKPYEKIKNLKRKAKTKINEDIKEAKESINELSFKTTFKDYKDALIEFNFIPTYRRIHPDLEDSVFGEKNGRFGSAMALVTEVGIILGTGIYGLEHHKDIKPFLVYIGAKALSHGSSAFYEHFRKIKQELELNN